MSNFASRFSAFVLLFGLTAATFAANAPSRATHGMVVSQNAIAAQIGVDVLTEGGSAVDAAVATAFAMAVTHPSAGNIGGGGFLIYRPASGEAVAYDFREVAPTGSHPEMWLDEGEYSFQRHHMSHMAVGVPGTVSGLHLAWRDAGKLPWKRLLQPAIDLAENGFSVSHGLSRSLQRGMRRMREYPASVAQFSKNGAPYEAGDVIKQLDLAASLERIAEHGSDGFYKGRTAELIVAEMQANGGLITMEDLAGYEAIKRAPIVGNYRGYEVMSMPPPSSGGIALVEMLNILEGYDLRAEGFGSANTLHRMTEAMRRAYADRALYIGDPEFNEGLPVTQLISKTYADKLRGTIRLDAASVSSPDTFTWPVESPETTHFSVVDAERNAVALTYTLEWGYGSGIVVPGAGFLLNNEMGDFNAGPGLTNPNGLIGTRANLAEPGKRMLSSMSPTIVSKDGKVLMVTGSPGGRTIINTVLQTILNVVDHGMNAQSAVDAGRIHHQWLPDTLFYEKHGFSPDSLRIMENLGHQLEERRRQGAAEVIVVGEDGMLQGGLDGRVPGGGAVGY
ncbi:MAG: gamma-glutamyltransferase [Gammaproteobacteria bacterium]|nr:gamma-glutamyltransferase [Gammaproteobacteria bacterium]